MKFSNLQIGLISGGILLLLLLLAFGRTTPGKKKGEVTEDVQQPVLTEEVVLSEARTALDSAQLAWLASLDKEKSQSNDVLQEAEVLKLISRTWFEYGNFLASAFYAKKVAQLLETGEAWGIAGTTYGIAFQRSAKAEEKKLAALMAIESLQAARNLEPDTLQHAINEALMHLELSTVDASVMPMKGIMMLQDLDKANPENLGINMTLGRLSATRTRDFAKAKPRFEKVIEIAEKNGNVDIHTLAEAYYYLIESYKAENNREKVISLYDKIIALSAENVEINQSFVISKKDYIESK